MTSKLDKPVSIVLMETVPSTWVDPWNRSHPVDKLINVVTAYQAGNFPYNNGYEIRPNRVFVDDKGSTYLEIPPTDFGGSTYYRRQPKDDGKSIWRTCLALRCIDKYDNPILPSTSLESIYK